MRRSVENAGRVEFFKDFPKPCFLTHRTDADFNLRRAEILHIQRIFQRIRIVFVYIKNNDFFRIIARDLPTKFRAYRTAAARDQNDFVVQVFAHLVIEFNRRAGKQVENIDLARFFQRGFVTVEFRVIRRHFNDAAGFHQLVQNFTFSRFGNIRDTEINLVHFIFFNGGSDLIAVADNRRSQNRKPEFFRVVI